MKVLIVEDEFYRDLRQAVEKVFPDFWAGFTGQDCHVATDFDKGRKLIGKNQYGVVLLDHLMPVSEYEGGFDEIGYGLIRYVRAKDSSTLVIGVSSRGPYPDFPNPDYVLRSKGKPECYDDLAKIVKEIWQVRNTEGGK